MRHRVYGRHRRRRAAPVNMVSLRLNPTRAERDQFEHRAEGIISIMLKRVAAAVGISLAALMGSPAQAIESLALKVLGFSPDGRYFAFVQYGGYGDHSSYIAETFVIDTQRDRFVEGVPIRVIVDMREENENEAEELQDLLKNAAKRSAVVMSRYNISRPGTRLVKVAEAKSDEVLSGSDRPTAGADAVTAKHQKIGDLRLKLAAKELPWSKASKLGPHKEAGSCAKEVDWANGVGFRLTLEQGGRETVLNDDKTIPASRHCVLGYGIAEVHAFDRPDGKVTLAVLLGMDQRGFEGNDRVFLAVTKVLDAPR
jgi:predicted secreted protein